VAPGRKRPGNAGGKLAKTVEKPRISLISDDFTKKKDGLGSKRMIYKQKNLGID
jgi:hypothetical protein